MMTNDEKLQKARILQDEAAALLRSIEEERTQTGDVDNWPPKSFYWWYHITSGAILGGFGSITSLLFNIIGSVIVGKHPLELIRVFMTFPMGEAALKSDADTILIIGVILYIVTGSMLGVLFELIMAKYFKDSSLMQKALVAIGISVAIWVVNFFAIISWMQPMLFGGSWILEMIPWWVAALTHIVFGLTMLLIGEWGHFEATDYKRQAMVRNQSSS
ncbi:MAG TPA: hypothetical protein VIX80_10980 [Candidatus Kapabacteria bacterium]